MNVFVNFERLSISDGHDGVGGGLTMICKLFLMIQWLDLIVISELDEFEKELNHHSDTHYQQPPLP